MITTKKQGHGGSVNPNKMALKNYRMSQWGVQMGRVLGRLRQTQQSHFGYEREEKW